MEHELTFAEPARALRLVLGGNVYIGEAGQTERRVFNRRSPRSRLIGVGAVGGRRGRIDVRRPVLGSGSSGEGKPSGHQTSFKAGSDTNEASSRL